MGLDTGMPIGNAASTNVVLAMELRLPHGVSPHAITWAALPRRTVRKPFLPLSAAQQMRHTQRVTAGGCSPLTTFFVRVAVAPADFHSRDAFGHTAHYLHAARGLP